MSIVKLVFTKCPMYKNKFRIVSSINYRSFMKVSQTSKYEAQILKSLQKSKCCFHTSECRRIPPYLALILRPLIRVTALIFGRKVKKWYANKSEEEKQEISEWFQERKHIFLGLLGLYAFSLFLFYITHLEYNPLTKRYQFFILNEKQQEQLAKITLETHLEEYQAALVPKSDAVYSKLLRVTANIIRANRDLPSFQNKKWTLTVVNSKDKNAYVLPGGNIFVFLGTLQMVENDDQLAVVISHEIAHAVLKHSYEQVSRGIIVELILAIPLALTWALFPDLLAGFLSLLGQSIVDIFYNLPYSRALETEADYIGLYLAAKACIDIREAVVFWATMRTLSELNIEPRPIPWLTTHPNHGDREKRLNKVLDEVIQFRKQAGCPLLSPDDPRRSFYKRTLPEQLDRLKKRGVIE